jgi:tRNA-splicing ligase RtcB (3'-phosphate/5'-hydroxy nucleic acid ligase)
MKQVIHDQGARPIKIWADEVEASALEQVKNLARLPFIASNGIACMPDIHAGKGSSVGTVIATKNVIIPSAVGVDIGCGMVAARLNISASDLPDNLADLRHSIERCVPVGNAGHLKQKDATHDARVALVNGTNNLAFSKIYDACFGGDSVKMQTKMWQQLGSLGGGNHFIELCIDAEDQVWIMLHSGSRGIGNMVGSHFINAAKEDMRRYHIDLPDVDLAYIPEGSPNYSDYALCVDWAQRFALENRRAMLAVVVDQLRRATKPSLAILDEAINCHHNYIAMENHFGQNLWITRKGAISARKDQLGIIPSSMGQKSYIVKGLGNADSYCSCSHGAGRRMSRTEARRRFSLQDLIAQTEGVECRKDETIIDEIPSAYKDMDTVMGNQKDLVEVVTTLKAVLCVKGG